MDDFGKPGPSSGRYKFIMEDAADFIAMELSQFYTDQENENALTMNSSFNTEPVLQETEEVSNQIVTPECTECSLTEQSFLKDLQDRQAEGIELIQETEEVSNQIVTPECTESSLTEQSFLKDLQDRQAEGIELIAGDPICLICVDESLRNQRRGYVIQEIMLPEDELTPENVEVPQCQLPEDLIVPGEREVPQSTLVEDLFVSGDKEIPQTPLVEDGFIPKSTLVVPENKFQSNENVFVAESKELPQCIQIRDNYSTDELDKIKKRISNALAFANHLQYRFDNFENETEVAISDQSKSEYEESKLLKKRAGRNSANFVHITADTRPEELMHLPGVLRNFIQEDLSTSSDSEQTSMEERPIVEEISPIPYPHVSKENENQLIIGPYGTLISKQKWFMCTAKKSTAAVLTRKILMAIFDRTTLATHSLTGRPSPAFVDQGKPDKKPLDQKKIFDTIYIVTSTMNATAKEVRMAITTKCADESKMLKSRDNKKLQINKNIRLKPY